jgi:hypothetical protein
MAYVPPHKRTVTVLPSDPIVQGAIILFHHVPTKTILLGEEGKWVFDSDASGSEFYRHHPIIYQTLPDTAQIPSPFGGKQTITLTPEQQTQTAMQPVLAHIAQSSQKSVLTPGTNLLIPIVEKSSKQTTLSGHTTYKVSPRKQFGGKEGCVKGELKNSTETALQCILREIYEEIGEIDKGLDRVTVTDTDWIRDASGARYVTYIKDKSGITHTYAIFYKQLTDLQVRKISSIIADRRGKCIGETFDVGFKHVPLPGSRGNLNPHTKDALEKVQVFLTTQGQRLYGGAKQSRRRTQRKRRTTSKCR